MKKLNDIKKVSRIYGVKIKTLRRWMKIKGPHKRGKYRENIRVINFENFKFSTIQKKEIPNITFFIFILSILTRIK